MILKYSMFGISFVCNNLYNTIHKLNDMYTTYCPLRTSQGMFPQCIYNKPSGIHHEDGQMLLPQPEHGKFGDFETKTRYIIYLRNVFSEVS